MALNGNDRRRKSTQATTESPSGLVRSSPGCVRSSPGCQNAATKPAHVNNRCGELFSVQLEVSPSPVTPTVCLEKSGFPGSVLINGVF